MTISKHELLSNPYLRRALSDRDAQLLGLMTEAQAQMAAPELTPVSMPESPPLSIKPTSKSKKPPAPSKPELQSHAEFLHWIKKLNRSLPPDKPLLALHFDPTSPTGAIPGWPDFSLFHLGYTKPLFIEFKRPKHGRLSPAQSLIIRYLKNLGHVIHIAFSANHAITITINHFQLDLLPKKQSQPNLPGS